MTSVLWRRAGGLVAAATIGFGSAACTALDDFLAAIPIFAFMREAPFFDPYEQPRPTPQQSVPFASPRGDPVPTFPNTVAGLEALANAVGTMPQLEPLHLQRGQVLYDRFCAVCHGPVGAGDGPIIGGGKFPFAPDLRIPLTVQRSDGYLYAVIRQGRGLMPPYGERLDHLERWYIVGYVRQLQQGAGGAGAGAQTPAAPPAAPTGQP